jgi:hypothetical protein
MEGASVRSQSKAKVRITTFHSRSRALRTGNGSTPPSGCSTLTSTVEEKILGPHSLGLNHRFTGLGWNRFSLWSMHPRRPAGAP